MAIAAIRNKRVSNLNEKLKSNVLTIAAVDYVGGLSITWGYL